MRRKIPKDIKNKIKEQRESVVPVSEEQPESKQIPRAKKKSKRHQLKEVLKDSNYQKKIPSKVWNFELGELVRFTSMATGPLNGTNSVVVYHYGMIIAFRDDMAFLQTPAGSGWYKCLTLKKDF